MNEKELKTAVSSLYDMECNNFMMNRAVNSLEQNISSLGIAKKIEKPVCGTTSPDFETPAYIGLFSGGIIGIIIGLCIGSGGNWGIFGAIDDALIWGIIGVIVGVLIAWSISILTTISYNSKAEKIYQAEVIEHNEKIKFDKERVALELRERDILLEEKSKLETRYEEACKKLAEFYDLSEIDGNYRNLIAIGYMNDFINLGISKSLEGRDGLYYLIRQELRLDQIGNILNDISDKLDSLIDINQQIYSELSRINVKCDTIISSTVKNARLLAENNQLLREKTAIDSYNLNRIARENEFQTFLTLTNYKN